MTWEDRIHSDPDSVTVSDLFEDIGSQEDRRQYEGVVGAYWLADLRPNRLEPFEDDLINLLGEMPDVAPYSPGDSGGSTTRNWATEAVGEYIKSNPDLVSRLFDLAKNSNERTREDARDALCYAVGGLGDSPEIGDSVPYLAEQVHNHRSIITDWLHDGRHSTTTTALILFARIAPWFCETSSEAVPVATSNLDDNVVYSSAMALLTSVALCNEQRRDKIVEQLIQGLPDTDTEDPNRLAYTLSHFLKIGKQHPESLSQMQTSLEELTDHEHDGVRALANNLNSLLEDV